MNRGSVSGFSNFIVNGVYYEEEDTTISVDNANAEATDLRLGMVVVVIGPIDDNG